MRKPIALTLIMACLLISLSITGCTGDIIISDAKPLNGTSITKAHVPRQIMISENTLPDTEPDDIDITLTFIRNTPQALSFAISNNSGYYLIFSLKYYIVFGTKGGSIMRDMITGKLRQQIDELGNDAVFIANDFLEIAEYETVRKALNRMVDDGTIHKILRGVYYRPRFSELLQEYEAPSPHQVALAVARKFNWNIAPSGITAMNMLGLSTQVSSKWSYISDGAYNSFEFGNTTIEFKRRNNREISGMSYMTALIIQGIKSMGNGNVDNAAITKIRASLSNDERKKLLNEAKPTTVWVYQVIRQICGGN